MRGKRSSLGVIGVLAGLLMALVAVSPAQATGGAESGPGEQVLVAPPAPAEAQARADAGVAAVAPTISPGASFEHVATGQRYTCAAGNLCTEVWDPTVNKWKVYKLYTCNRYYLSNWLNTGYYVNNQTGNPTSYFYGRYGDVIKPFKPHFGAKYSQNWNPVWSIRNC
ncbi:hypothetical protein [Streptomyces harbinensis]|uniref:hypothetical protein n=1 Tax=Streptomyces harbinensis TaxID=1176198 RepID=UPI0034DEC917